MEDGARQMAPVAVQTHKRRPLLVDLIARMVREKPLGTVGGAIVLLLLLTGILADVVAPYGESEIMLLDRLQGYSGTHLLGTDHLGRDMLSRIIFGARVSVVVGLGVATLSSVISLIIGMISGYLGGKADLTIQRFVDAWQCFPGLFIILTVMAVVGAGLTQVVIVLGMMYGISGSRTVRSAVIAIKGNVYVEAARALGSPTRLVLIRHILPNIMAPVIIVFTTRMGAAILTEATISFLGYGIPPPTPSWGGMLSGDGRRFMQKAPWMALWPGFALALTVYGINMFGDGIRDILDPRLRGGLGRYSGAERKREKRRQQEEKRSAAA
jgi:peptide/nickel transport system permease protein